MALDRTYSEARHDNGAAMLVVVVVDLLGWWDLLRSGLLGLVRST